VQATAESVISTEFATVLGDREGPLVPPPSMCLRAARHGCRQRIIEARRSGSSDHGRQRRGFVAAIDPGRHCRAIGVRRFIQVLKPVQVSDRRFLRRIASPMPPASAPEVEIDFANPVIGRQSYVLDLTPERFRREICPRPEPSDA
jgi:UDP-3-O-[3-hydroxymyristoyl] N-acetylglucosamine deacetylase